jgi:DNA-binding NarL/FixJ family response regulator
MGCKMKKIRLLLVDDQVLFVESLKSVIETKTEDIEVVGIARNGEQAIEAVEKRTPDIVLMDVRMPIMDGVEATRRIHDKSPDVRILVLTTFDEDKYVMDAIRHGALGYLLKDIPPSELIAAIRAVNEGASLVSPALLTKIFGDRALSDTKEIGQNELWHERLSNREMEILELVSEGYENRQIAEKLFIAEQTVRNYVSGIYAKIGVHSRLQAIKTINSWRQR